MPYYLHMSTCADGRKELGTRVSATELHRRTAEVLRLIRQGRTVEVTFGHFAEVQARLVPATAEAPRET